MKRILTSLATLVFVTAAANAADSVYINEVLPNGPGSDTGNEYFELRGTPNMSLAGYYLLSLEGQGSGLTLTNRGDVNQYFNLGSFSLGANGYLFARQTYADLSGSKYTDTAPGASVVQSDGGGWQSTYEFYHGDGTQADLENGATTILLIKVESGGTPPVYTGGQATDDLDTNDDGILDLPTGWTVVDSVGIMDGASAAATDVSYGVITFRAPLAGSGMAGTYNGTCAYGNIIDVPPPAYSTTAGAFHVGRKGVSTGSTSNDWVGSVVDGAAASPLAFYSLSSSDPSYTGMTLINMVYGGENPGPAPLGELSYTPTINGTRFTTNTIVTPGGPVGDVAVDPRDNTTILFNTEVAGGGIYRAYKVASGNWWVDSTPVVSGLDRPSGLVVQDNGTLWWVHPYRGSLMRLKAPWAANTPKMVITNTGFNTVDLDDDPIDLTLTPANFSGTVGQPGWLVIADRGSDSDPNNALNLQDPATTLLDQINNNFLVSPSESSLGWGNLDAIGSLPQSGEVVTVSTDGYISAIDGNGAIRNIAHNSVVMTACQALAVDPNTGKVWVADDGLDEVWSVDPSLTPAAETKELSFPLKDPSPSVSFRQMNFHDPGMVFSTNGAFLVVSDTSTVGGGGRLIIFHSEPYVSFSLSNFSITNVTQTVSGPQLQWTPAGDASFNLKYSIQRSTSVTSAASFATIATVTGSSFTDTNAPSEAAFYRVIAKP